VLSALLFNQNNTYSLLVVARLRVLVVPAVLTA